VTPVADDSADGRRIFLVIAVSVVLIAGGIGFFVGANGASVAPTITLLGGFALPTTPLTMSVYGILLAGVSLAVLFGLVTLASRFDTVDEADDTE
jgi:Zn-dependent membrane protease YugP